MNPGSDEAITAGCLCPRIDNGHGKGIGGDGARFGWVIREGCPIHGDLMPPTAWAAITTPTEPTT
jgi:hypothetical protein